MSILSTSRISLPSSSESTSNLPQQNENVIKATYSENEQFYNNFKQYYEKQRGNVTIGTDIKRIKNLNALVASLHCTASSTNKDSKVQIIDSHKRVFIGGGNVLNDAERKQMDYKIFGNHTGATFQYDWQTDMFWKKLLEVDPYIVAIDQGSTSWMDTDIVTKFQTFLQKSNVKYVVIELTSPTDRLQSPGLLYFLKKISPCKLFRDNFTYELYVGNENEKTNAEQLPFLVARRKINTNFPNDHYYETTNQYAHIPYLRFYMVTRPNNKIVNENYILEYPMNDSKHETNQVFEIVIDLQKLLQLRETLERENSDEKTSKYRDRLMICLHPILEQEYRTNTDFNGFDCVASFKGTIIHCRENREILKFSPESTKFHVHGQLHGDDPLCTSPPPSLDVKTIQHNDIIKVNGILHCSWFSNHVDAPRIKPPTIENITVTLQFKIYNPSSQRPASGPSNIQTQKTPKSRKATVEAAENKQDQSKKIVGILIAMVALGFGGARIVKALKRVKKLLDDKEVVTMKNMLGSDHPQYNKLKTSYRKNRKR